MEFYIRNGKSMNTRPEKILIAMYGLSKGTDRPCRYEDIVVKAFELYPVDFQLRGYPQYPDSSDIHKPLYGPLKRQGLVRAANKMFSLTEKGLTKAKIFAHPEKSNNSDGVGRVTRDVAREIERLKVTNAWRLFLEGHQDKILDTDFYVFLGVTVRTERNSFLGRARSVEDAVKIAAKVDPQTAHLKLEELSCFLFKKFDAIIKKQHGGQS